MRGAGGGEQSLLAPREADSPSSASVRDARTERARNASMGSPPGDGRPLTLGERKSLARRPDRDMMQRLLNDPHPDADLRRCLRNPRMTEDDLVRLAAKRPGRGAVLAEIARSTKWSHRPRVRMALVMNPATPTEIAVRIAGLLLRPELELVVHSPAVPSPVRALCMEHLSRRPPTSLGNEDPEKPVH